MGSCFRQAFALYLYIFLMRLIQSKVHRLSASNSQYSCQTAGAGATDICVFHCNTELPEFKVFNCDNAGQCIVICDTEPCMIDGTINANNAGYLNATSLSGGRRCFRRTTINLPDSGDATLIMGEEKTFTYTKIYAGSNTQNVFIDCTFGNGAGSECRGMEVYASTAQYLEIVVGALSELDAGADARCIINCPQNSAYNGLEIAPCIVDISGGGLFQSCDVNTLNGAPQDFNVKVGSGVMDDVKLKCGAGTTMSVGNSFPVNSVCWIPETTSNPFKQPTSNPTLKPTHTPTGIPTVPPSNGPSVSPTHSPSVFPTQFPSESPTTLSPTPPGAFICGESVVGEYNGQALEFTVLMTHAGDIIFDMSHSSFTIIGIEVYNSDNRLLETDFDGNQIIHLTTSPAGWYKFYTMGNQETGLNYDVRTTCTTNNPTPGPTSVPSIGPTSSEITPAPITVSTNSPSMTSDPSSLAPTKRPSKDPSNVPSRMHEDTTHTTNDDPMISHDEVHNNATMYIMIGIIGVLVLFFAICGYMVFIRTSDMKSAVRAKQAQIDAMAAVKRVESQSSGAPVGGPLAVFLIQELGESADTDVIYKRLFKLEITDVDSLKFIDKKNLNSLCKQLKLSLSNEIKFKAAVRKLQRGGLVTNGGDKQRIETATIGMNGDGYISSSGSDIDEMYRKSTLHDDADTQGTTRDEQRGAVGVTIRNEQREGGIVRMGYTVEGNIDT
eukprot:774663_1